MEIKNAVGKVTELKVEVENKIAVISIDRLGKKGIDITFMDDLLGLFSSAEGDPEIRGIVMTSYEKNIFCLGLNPYIAMEYSRYEMEIFIRRLTELCCTIFGLPKPVVAAINGHALGGGCYVCLAADYRIMAAAGGEIGMIESSLGMPMPFGIVKMIEHVLGKMNGERSVILGERLNPEAALKLGLIDEISELDSLVEKAVHWAQVIGGRSSLAYYKNKEYFRRSTVTMMKTNIDKYTSEWIQCWESPECQSVMRATFSRGSTPKETRIDGIVDRTAG